MKPRKLLTFAVHFPQTFSGSVFSGTRVFLLAAIDKPFVWLEITRCVVSAEVLHEVGSVPRVWVKVLKLGPEGRALISKKGDVETIMLEGLLSCDDSTKEFLKNPIPNTRTYEHKQVT